jgi:dihydrolipoamide dehydrogenase
LGYCQGDKPDKTEIKIIQVFSLESKITVYYKNEIDMDYDLIVIGSGPGGYVAAIRAAQLKMKVAVVERAEIGGICLNWGCIPTKALLMSAHVYEYAAHAKDFGVSIEGGIKPDFKAIIARSRSIAEGMSKGVQFLFRKNNIEHVKGFGRLAGDNKVEVQDADGNKKTITAKKISLLQQAQDPKNFQT